MRKKQHFVNLDFLFLFAEDILKAMLVASAVFPIDGLPANISKSDL